MFFICWETYKLLLAIALQNKKATNLVANNYRLYMIDILSDTYLVLSSIYPSQAHTFKLLIYRNCKVLEINILHLHVHSLYESVYRGLSKTHTCLLYTKLHNQIKYKYCKIMNK